MVEGEQLILYIGNDERVTMVEQKSELLLLSHETESYLNVYNEYVIQYSILANVQGD